MLTSLQNPQVKHTVLLQQKTAERRRSGLFVVEGLREVEQCLAAGYEVETLFTLSDNSCESGEFRDFRDSRENGVSGASVASGLSRDWPVPAASVIEVSPAVYEKMAYRGGTEGVLAVVKQRDMALENLPMCENPLYVVLESVEKPGNLGAILRSADAAQADAVIVCDPLCDLYNPNLIRSSLGARFTVPVLACSSEECIEFLKRRGVSILTAQLQDSELYYDTDMTRSIALVMGTESTGLTQRWRDAADAHIRIPMLGKLDSLNVSVSTAILLFEAVRQRRNDR